MRLKRNYRYVERVVKGFANNRRIEILELLSKQTNLSLNDISGILNMNIKTSCEHIRKMVIAGLVIKRYNGSVVEHSLSSRGQKVLDFLKELE